VHDAGTLADGRVFYAMKFVEGERLDALVMRMIAIPDRLRIFQRICEAVAFAHARGILHRDLKPENIMVGPFGEVLVMDWGVAKILREDPEQRERRTSEGVEGSRNPHVVTKSLKTEHGTILGTPGYMAPEQARGEIESVDERADIYSLGAILKFLTKASSTIESGCVPKPVAAIAQKAMGEEPASRYGSVGDLAEDVARCLDGAPVSAYPENIFQKAARWATRYRVAIGLVVAYLVVRALLLLWLRR
jgi:serine/threonine protein kinase